MNRIALLAALSAIAIVACAGGSHYKAASGPPVSSTNDAGPLPDDPRAAIKKLDQQIDIDLARQGTTTPEVLPCSGASCATSMAAPMSLAPRADNQCHPAKTETCTDICTIGDSICDNAAKICQLAAQLPADDWAANRCSTRKASCSAAHDRCCTCNS